MNILSIVKSAIDGGISPLEVASWIVKYGPAIAAIVHFIELEEDEKKRAAALDDITRGLQIAAETRDTTFLEDAMRAHISSAGVRVD